jgi:hypothetical protein
MGRSVVVGPTFLRAGCMRSAGAGGTIRCKTRENDIRSFYGTSYVQGRNGSYRRGARGRRRCQAGEPGGLSGFWMAVCTPWAGNLSTVRSATVRPSTISSTLGGLAHRGQTVHGTGGSTGSPACHSAELWFPGTSERLYSCCCLNIIML